MACIFLLRPHYTGHLVYSPWAIKSESNLIPPGVKVPNSFKWQTEKHLRAWKLTILWEPHLLLQPLSLIFFHQWFLITLPSSPADLPASFILQSLGTCPSLLLGTIFLHICVGLLPSHHQVFSLYVTTSEKPSLTTLAKVPLHCHITNHYLPNCFYFPTTT